MQQGILVSTLNTAHILLAFFLPRVTSAFSHSIIQDHSLTFFYACRHACFVYDFKYATPLLRACNNRRS